VNRRFVEGHEILLVFVLVGVDHLFGDAEQVLVLVVQYHRVVVLLYHAHGLARLEQYSARVARLIRHRFEGRVRRGTERRALRVQVDLADLLLSLLPLLLFVLFLGVFGLKRPLPGILPLIVHLINLGLILRQHLQLFFVDSARELRILLLLHLVPEVVQVLLLHLGRSDLSDLLHARVQGLLLRFLGVLVDVDFVGLQVLRVGTRRVVEADSLWARTDVRH